MPLIINSNGKIEHASPLQGIVRRLSTIFRGYQLDTATGEALDKVASAYGIHREGNISDAEFRDQIFDVCIK